MMFADGEGWLEIAGPGFHCGHTCRCLGSLTAAVMVSRGTQHRCKSHPAEWLWHSGLMISTRCQCRFIGLDIKSLCCFPWQIKGKTVLELHNRFDCALECIACGGATLRALVSGVSCEQHPKM